jgi:parallel beta-helix repeat protein
MTTRRVSTVAAVATTVVIALNVVPAALAAPSTEGSARQVVTAGQSIQAAVDRAAPGGEIDVMPGTYHGSVQITTPGLTVRGMGPSTVLVPSTNGSENACSRAGHGVCVAGTDHHGVADVHLADLTVQGFRRNGVNASYADRLRVTGLIASDNGEQGISEERSVRGLFRDNTAFDNGQAGIFLANTVNSEAGAIDTQGTRVIHNRLTDNRFGVVLRRVRDLSVEANLVSANCGGVFVVGDENVPRAGDLDVADNQVIANNKHCAASSRLPVIQGTGILLTGTDHARVTGNQVIDNAGTSPMSGGIVLFGSIVGVHNTGAAVSDNVAVGNGPADLAVRDTKGTGNTLAGNTCASSVPDSAGGCG